MADPRTTNALMSSLIDGTFGCLDAAAETVHARWGRGPNKGTLSKRLSGQLSWPVDDVIALEDAAARYPVTRMLARRLKDAPPGGICLITHAGSISKETGEAVAAILAAELSARSESIIDALSEIDEALVSLRAARAQLEQSL